MGAGWLASVSEYGREGGFWAPATEYSPFEDSEWLEGLLVDSTVFCELAGSDEGTSETLARFGFDWRGRTTGSEMVPKALWVLSSAAAAALEKMLPEERWLLILGSEEVEADEAW